jgi:hypothetical protein
MNGVLAGTPGSAGMRNGLIEKSEVVVLNARTLHSIDRISVLAMYRLPH